jgi:RNA polymerase sigma-70 factor (ECF subfamily)
MPATDGQLVRRAHQGEAEAFGYLVNKYRDMLYGIAYHLTRDFDAARDLAQEAFVQAYLRLGQLRNPDRFASWLRRIAVNLHRNNARRRSIANVPLAPDASTQQQGELPSEVELAVREALKRLPGPDRLALTLHYINGYSQAEIGAFLGVRAETIKTRLARARRRLREEVLGMIEDTFGSKRLPDAFTDATVAEALRRGQTALEEEDYEAAIAAFNEVIASQPESAHAHAGLGVAWALRKYHGSDPEAAAKARAEYEKALKYDPQCEEALVGLAELSPGDKREAYRRALAALPKSAWLRYRLAWETHAAGDTQQAVEMMTVLLSDAVPVGVRVLVHNNLGTFFHDALGDPTTGREHFRLAAEASEGTRLVFFHWRVYARVSLGDKQWQQTRQAAAHILDRAPTDFERRNLHVVLACALANLGRTDEAMQHLEQAAKPAPEPPGAERWPFRVSGSADPLDWVRANAEEYCAPIAGDPRFHAILDAGSCQRTR